MTKKEILTYLKSCSFYDTLKKEKIVTKLVNILSKDDAWGKLENSGHIDYECAYRLIFYSFTWGHTDEGYDFWFDKHNKLKMKEEPMWIEFLNNK